MSLNRSQQARACVSTGAHCLTTKQMTDAHLELMRRDEDDRAREDKGGPDFFNGFFLALTIVGIITAWSMFG